jgi:NADPH:quinone reductase-like Zn-dependent oxidoreductase
VFRLTKGRGVDVVLDPIGGRSFDESYRMLAPMGRLIMVGVSSIAADKRSWPRLLKAWWTMPSFAPLSLINRNRGVFGLNVGHLWNERRPLQSLMEMILEELRAGRLQPVVSKTFPLERAADAHRFIQSRSNIGKVVLTT